MTRWTDLAKWHGPSPNSGPEMRSYRGLVIHIAQGYYQGTINWQLDPTAGTASHFIVGKSTGECAQLVDTAEQAWTQRAGNPDWLSVEEVGFVPDALTNWQVEQTARLFARGHREYGWPLQVANNPSQRGLGHHSMDREGTDPEWGHDECPGVNIIAQKPLIVQRAIEIVNGGELDMEQDDKLEPEYDTGDPNRKIGHVLADLENLRNFLVSPVGTVGLIGVPLPSSPLDLLLRYLNNPVTAVTLTAEQAKFMADQIAAQLPDGFTPAQITSIKSSVADVLLNGAENV